MDRAVRTLVVDDSALVRRMVQERLAEFPQVEVVGVAADPFVARDKILELEPDVMTLDLEMPRMDGLTFLRVLMKHRPMPVVVMSSTTPEGSAKALDALEAGAVEVLGKPHGWNSAPEAGAKLARAILAAAQAGRNGLRRVRATEAATVESAAGAAPEGALVLAGASTGGPEALRVLLSGLPKRVPAIAIVQHIPGYFSRALAERLNEASRIEVREARDGDRLRPGLALLAPGGMHMAVRCGRDGFEVGLSKGPKLHFQRPSVDVLFDSAAKCGAARRAMAVLLTGMGVDGAIGMEHLREAGAVTVAQDEASCAVFGMPREAIRRGAAGEVLPLEAMASRICRFAEAIAATPVA